MLFGIAITLLLVGGGPAHATMQIEGSLSSHRRAELVVAPNSSPLDQSTTPRTRRVIVLQDVTTSGRDTTGVPRLAVADAARLFDSLKESGNFELIFGIVNARSGLDFHRCTAVNARPMEPSQPRRDVNPFQKRVLLRQYEEAMTKHRVEVAAWSEDTANTRRACLSAIVPLLKGSYAAATDAVGALNAAAVLFAEDRAFRTSTAKFLIAVSDLDDNVGRAFAGLPSDVSVFVVNKLGVTGVLASRFPKPEVLFDFSPVIELAKGWR